MSTAISQNLTTSPLDIALSYAAQGWPVFPCRPADDFDPETGEVLPEKAPLISNGFRGATTNERVIRELWKRHPDAVIGVPTGERTNVWVLDLDVKANANGHEWLEAAEAANEPLPYSARVQTANGGTHIFFRYVEGVRNRGKLGAGVDVRGEGGFVVAGGSVMADGRAYNWLDDTGQETVVDAPQWLLDLVLPPVNTYRAGDWQYTSGSNDGYVKRAVELELSELACSPPGNRGYQLNASAFALGTMVGAGALPRSEAEHWLYAAAVTCGVAQADGERETWAKIRRGLDAGEKQPRHIPERTGSNDNTPIVGLGKLVRGATGAEAAKEAATLVDVNGDSVQDSEQPAVPPSAQAAPPTTPPPIFVATPYTFKNPKTLPRREFAFGTHYIRKYVSVTVSPGGLGKTSNSIVESLSMISGRDLTGIKPPSRLKVWLFNAEDPRDEMERRIQAACLHYRLKPDDINGHLFLDTGREQDLVVAVDDKQGTKIQVPIVRAVIEQILAHEIDVMIVDPFVSTHAVNENDNGAIDKVAKLWAQIADDTNCAIDIVHHLRKVADREATVEDARGAVSLIGAARSVRVLNRMSEEQATTAGVPVADRFSYFNIHQGKANLTKLSASLDWRRLESVPLGNGTTWKPQDFAGVVTEWRWPGSEDIKDGLTSDQLLHIKTLLDNSDYKPAANAKNWAGQAVAYALGVDLEDSGQKKRVGTILKALIKEGEVVEVFGRDPISRKVAAFLRSNEYEEGE